MRIVLATLFALLLATAPQAHGQDAPKAYALFTTDGEPATWTALLDTAAQADFVAFGELHDHPICHWLQLQFAQELHARTRKLALGLEMIERDQEPIFQQYMARQLTYKQLQDTLKLWPNWDGDYQPIVRWARNNDVAVTGTNVPRPYARMVARHGLDTLQRLPKSVQALMAPLPIEIDYELSTYKGMLGMMHGHGHGHTQQDGTKPAAKMKGPAAKKARLQQQKREAAHNARNTRMEAMAKQFVAAQAIKDATMAWFTHQAMTPGTPFLHLHGGYHTQERQGILWYLQRYRPSVKAVVLTTVLQRELDSLEAEHHGKGDFILVVPKDMPRTH